MIVSIKVVFQSLFFYFRLLDQIDTLNQTSKKELEKEKASREELSAAYQKTIDRLENDIKQQKALTNESNEKLTAHDAAAKRAIGVLQKEMGAKVEQVTTLFFACICNISLFSSRFFRKCL